MCCRFTDKVLLSIRLAGISAIEELLLTPQNASIELFVDLQSAAFLQLHGRAAYLRGR